MLSFWADLMLSSTLVLVLFLVGRALGQVVISLDPGRFVASFTERHLLYALPFFVVLAVTIQFVIQMNRMIGANVLRYFIAGIYHWWGYLRSGTLDARPAYGSRFR